MLAAAPHDPRTEAEVKPTVARRILVADDESMIRLLCRVNLKVEGMEVLEAPDGEQALELARRERPDLVLLDVMMPGLDGWSVARALADDEDTREIPIIFLTARAETADRLRAHELGGVGYILKPFDPIRLADTIELTLARIARGERALLVEELVDPR